VALLFLAPRAFAQPKQKNVIVFPDLTQSTSADSFQSNVHAISGIIGKLSYGDRLWCWESQMDLAIRQYCWTGLCRPEMDILISRLEQPVSRLLMNGAKHLKVWS